MKEPKNTEAQGGFGAAPLLGQLPGNKPFHLIKEFGDFAVGIFAASKMRPGKASIEFKILWFLVLMLSPISEQAAPVFSKGPDLVNRTPQDWNRMGEKLVHLDAGLISPGSQIRNDSVELVAAIVSPLEMKQAESTSETKETTNSGADSVLDYLIHVIVASAGIVFGAFLAYWVTNKFLFERPYRYPEPRRDWPWPNDRGERPERIPPGAHEKGKP